MMSDVRILTLLFCALTLPVWARPSTDTGLSGSLRRAAGIDTVCNVWVFFTDRPVGDAALPVSRRALQRRLQAGYRPGDGDRPVNRGYISEIERRGGKLRHEFAWENAASFSIHSSTLNDISALPFVKRVKPVAVYIRRGVDDNGLAKSFSSASTAKTASFNLPGYDWHMDMVNIPLAHEYIKARRLGNPGDGVIIAFFDSGFRFDHRAMARVRESGIAAARDFVDGDDTVYDPDSVVNDPFHPYHQGDAHGTQTLALAAAYHPGVYMGGAWGARFALARTEDIQTESKVEEDNWAAAVLWAESEGAHIISSSLGYREFDDESYGAVDMDGRTTIVSRAAAGAVERGVIVVNSAGNESRVSNPSQTLTAPADVDGVTAVGAVDRGRSIASFSSAGPTADGRIKPDVAAPGLAVPLPDVYSPGRDSYGAWCGTSFAAPIVAAVYALILQTNPGITAEEARQRLYASCGFASGQTFKDNRRGYGIPNALRAVMRDDEIFIRVVDAEKQPLTGAQVRAGAKSYTANESGFILMRADAAALPLDLRISFRGDSIGAETVVSLPFEGVFSVDVKRRDGMRVLPSIVRRNSVVRGKYYFTDADMSTPAVAMVRTLNGRKVWEQKLQLRPDGSAEFIWDGARRAASGIYFITVRHGYSQLSGRVVISN